MRTGTRIQAVMTEVRSRIASRAYLPGARLPSVRTQARTMALSVSTVVEAYGRLTAEGLIVSRPGSGFYVAGPVAPLALTEIGPKLELVVDPLWVSRQSLETDATVLKPGCGWLPSEWMYQAGMRRALRSVARAGALVLTEYATPMGHPDLRRHLARRLMGTGLEVAPDQIMLTESGTQSIDLVCRFLLEPGDTVLVDDPCYFNFLALLKAHRARIVGVPHTPTGPDIAAFAQAVQEHRPRLYITNAGLHNPTGAVLSPAVAHRILQLAEGSDLVIVEDDIFADFETNPSPRLAVLDGLSRVIHTGSFSKTVSASLRCGHIAARPDWIGGLLDLKLATSFGGGRLASDTVFAILTDGGYRKYLEEIRLRLADAMEATVTRLRRIGLQPWYLPRAGMFLWCRLPGRRDAADVARACLEEGVVLAPGNAFSSSLSATEYLRFNVAQSREERVFEVLDRALSA